VSQPPPGAGLGPIAQLGYVVDDIERAMRRWLEHHDVGPFFFLPRPPLADLRYRGEPTSAAIAVALTYSGELQIELIQPLDAEPSPYLDFARRSGAGLHHVARFTDEFDAALARCRALGRQPYFEGRGLGTDQRFAYFEGESNDVGTVNEVVETVGLGGFFDYMRARCADWDGAEPIRTIFT